MAKLPLKDPITRRKKLSNIAMNYRNKRATIGLMRRNQGYINGELFNTPLTDAQKDELAHPTRN